MKYEYDTVLHETDDNGGAYVVFPWDIRQEFGKGRVKVHADFDGIPYDGSIVNMMIGENLCLKFTDDEAFIQHELQNALPRVQCLELTIDHMTGKLVNES